MKRGVAISMRVNREASKARANPAIGELTCDFVLCPPLVWLTLLDNC